MRSFAAALLVLFSGGPTAAAEADALLRSAHFDERAGVVRYEPFTTVDWEQLARRHFRRFDMYRPTERDIAYLRERIWEVSNDAEETFNAPLSDVESAQGLRLVSASGMMSLRPAKFEGTVRFSFDHGSPPQIVERLAYGYVVSRRISKDGGGFVLRTSKHNATQIPAARISLHVEQRHRMLTYEEGEKRVSVVLPGKWHDTIRAAYGFRVGDTTYAFVAWPADESGIEALCAFNFSLYRVAAVLETVAHNNYGCDV